MLGKSATITRVFSFHPLTVPTPTCCWTLPFNGLHFSYTKGKNTSQLLGCFLFFTQQLTLCDLNFILCIYPLGSASDLWRILQASQILVIALTVHTDSEHNIPGQREAPSSQQNGNVHIWCTILVVVMLKAQEFEGDITQSWRNEKSEEHFNGDLCHVFLYLYFYMNTGMCLFISSKKLAFMDAEINV